MCKCHWRTLAIGGMYLDLEKIIGEEEGEGNGEETRTGQMLLSPFVQLTKKDGTKQASWHQATKTGTRRHQNYRTPVTKYPSNIERCT